MKIYVCQIIPPSVSQNLKEIVESYNVHLLNPGETNGVGIMKTKPNFKLSTGEPDDLFFKGDALSRIKIIRLLDTVANQCSEFTLCKNWKQVRKSSENLATMKVDKTPPGGALQSTRHPSSQPLSMTPSLPPAGVPPPSRSAGNVSAPLPPPGQRVQSLHRFSSPIHLATELPHHHHLAYRVQGLLHSSRPTQLITRLPRYLHLAPRSGAVLLFTHYPVGQEAGPQPPYNPVDPGAAPLFPLYPAGHGAVPPSSPSDAALPCAHVWGTGSDMQYLPSDASARAVPRDGARVWGSYAVRHSPLGRKSRCVAAHTRASRETYAMSGA